MKHPTDSPQYKADMAIEAEPTSPEKLFYLSFADSNQFLGGLFIYAKSLSGAISASHKQGVNPGGEIQCFEILALFASSVDAKWIGRLLTREDIAEMNRELGE